MKRTKVRTVNACTGRLGKPVHKLDRASSVYPSEHITLCGLPVGRGDKYLPHNKGKVTCKNCLRAGE
jgi:hypothetical protein